MNGYDINSINVEYGDAAFSLYYIFFDKEKNSSYNSDIVANVFHKHSYYELHLITEGNTCYLTENGKISVKEGQLLIIPPGVTHLTDCNGGNCVRTVISIALNKTNGEKGCYNFFLNRLNELSLKPFTVGINITEKIIKMSSKNIVSLQQFCKQKSLAYSLILDLFCENGNNTVGKHDNTETERKLLLENMINDNRFSVKEIAEKLDYSERHVLRLIKEQYGESLLKLRKNRMLSTVSLLKEDFGLSKKEIEDIIYRV